MESLKNLNLIRLFDFYLATAFLISTVMRIRQYEAVIRLVGAAPDRWPKLLRLVRTHHAVFLTWTTVRPALLALGLSVIHTLACRLIWPHADLSAWDLAEHWVAAPTVVITGLTMLTFDIYATFRIGEVDRPMLEKYFDQAEYWLRSWVAPVVRVFTLGYINPRRMVHEEVRKALVMASELLNTTLWWVTAQVTLRILFGLSLWMAWAWLT